MMADRDDQGQLIWYAEPEVHLAICRPDANKL